MENKSHFLLIDKDGIGASVPAGLLQKAGHQVTLITAGSDAFDQILKLQPDCIIGDFSVSELEASGLMQQLKIIPLPKKPVFIVLSDHFTEQDKEYALNLGVDGYFAKPVQNEMFVNEVEKVLSGNMLIQFWGVRGTLPVPGEKTLRYGGNTNCVTLKFGEKEFFIFDAGTGIKELSNHLVKENKFPLKAKIFISHPHYDHINGIPFFVPLYMEGNTFEIFGTHHAGFGIDTLISHQMDNVYFPITINAFSANLTFRNLKEEEFFIGDLKIKTIMLNHPGRCLGFRVQYRNKSFCYLTDNEMYLADSPNYKQEDVDKVVEFMRDSSVVVIDATYCDEEYARKTGWGHSCITRVIEIANQAKVKLLCLYHHDPDQMDVDIDRKLAVANQLLKDCNSTTVCIAPGEGDKIEI